MPKQNKGDIQDKQLSKGPPRSCILKSEVLLCPFRKSRSRVSFEFIIFFPELPLGVRWKACFWQFAGRKLEAHADISKLL